MHSTATTYAVRQLADLAYELLDALDDTARLAAKRDGDDLRWDAHVQYLRDLQRVGRDVLAHARPHA
ncbi:MAG TPA: hypothetical protein VK506_14755 [Conexibacter sp.]|nr:hypothetical protein [Conexibacter sp.]